MKKLCICACALLLLVSGCSSNKKTETSAKTEKSESSSVVQESSTQPEKVSVHEVNIKNYSLFTSFSEIESSYTNTAFEIYKDVYGNDNYSYQQMFTYLGMEVPDGLVLTDLNGNTYNTTDLKNKKVIYEIGATYCDHCQLFSKTIMDDFLEAHKNEDVIIFQMFYDGDETKIQGFYDEIGKDIPDGLIVIPQSDDAIDLIWALNVAYMPSLVFQDESGRISWYHQGDTTLEEMNKAFEYAYGDKKVYEYVKEGVSTENFILTGNDVRNHLDEEVVAKIEEVYHGEVSDFYGNLGKSFALDLFPDLNGDSIAGSLFVNQKTVYIICYGDEESNSLTQDIEAYAQLTAKYPDTNFVFAFKAKTGTLLSSYYQTVKDKIGYAFSKDESYAMNDIYLSAVPLYLFVDENNRICGAWHKESADDDFDAAYELFYGDTPLYELVK